MTDIAVFVDADMLLFRAAAGCQVDTELEPGMWISQLNHHQAKDVFWESVEQLCAQVEAPVEHAMLCWTSRSFFRRNLYPAYKANRASTRKPPGYAALIADMLTHPQSVCHDMLESDDLLSIFSRVYGPDRPHVICSGDKDLKQVPGIHLWLDNPGQQVTPLEAKRLFWQQAMTGDTTDNYPGAKGVGPQTASKLLGDTDPFDDAACWRIVLQAYRDAGHQDWQADALINTQLAQLLHPTQYDFATHEVTPWQPPATALDQPLPVKPSNHKRRSTKSSSSEGKATGTRQTRSKTDSSPT